LTATCTSHVFPSRGRTTLKKEAYLNFQVRASPTAKPIAGDNRPRNHRQPTNQSTNQPINNQSLREPPPLLQSPPKKTERNTSTLSSYSTNPKPNSTPPFQSLPLRLHQHQHQPTNQTHQTNDNHNPPPSNNPPRKHPVNPFVRRIIPIHLPRRR